MQPKRRRDDGVVSEDVRRQSQKRAPRSHGVPACTAPPRAKPHPRHGTKREGEDTAHFKMNQHPAQTPARLSATAESGLACPNPLQAKSNKRYQKQRESEDTVHDGSKKRDREATPKRPSMRAEKCEEPASERIRVSWIQRERCQPWVSAHSVVTCMGVSDGSCCRHRVFLVVLLIPAIARVPCTYVPMAFLVKLCINLSNDRIHSRRICNHFT